jgi:uncharacterized protein (DUF2249 family)
MYISKLEPGQRREITKDGEHEGLAQLIERVNEAPGLPYLKNGETWAHETWLVKFITGRYAGRSVVRKVRYLYTEDANVPAFWEEE